MERLRVRLWTHGRSRAPRLMGPGRLLPAPTCDGARSKGAQRRQMICLSSRVITRPRPMDVGVAALSEYPQAGGGCSREERKEVSVDGEEEVVALMPSG